MAGSGDLFFESQIGDGGCHACAIGDLQLASARDEAAHLRHFLAELFELGVLDARHELKARAVMLLSKV